MDENQDFKKLSLKLGLLRGDMMSQFTAAKTCEQKQSMYTQTQDILFYDTYRGSKVFRT